MSTFLAVCIDVLLWGTVLFALYAILTEKGPTK